MVLAISRLPLACKNGDERSFVKGSVPNFNKRHKPHRRVINMAQGATMRTMPQPVVVGLDEKAKPGSGRFRDRFKL